MLANIADGFCPGALGAGPGKSNQALELGFAGLNKVGGFPRQLFLSAGWLLPAHVFTLALVVHSADGLHYESFS